MLPRGLTMAMLVGGVAACDALLGIGDYGDRPDTLTGRLDGGLDGGDLADGPDTDGPRTDGGKDASTALGGSIDFGTAPDGGPTLSTMTCPALSMPTMAAATLYVDTAAGEGGTGTKAAPFRTLAQAFASAEPLGVIWVAAGTYQENLVIPDKNLLVLGGFAQGFETRTDACATTLEAASSSAPVLSADDQVSTFAMEGFSVTKGSRGISVTGNAAGKASFTIARCVFSNNGTTAANSVGGAAALGDVNVRVFGSVFRDNRAGKGAALAAGGNVTLTIDQNLFLRNLGTSDHGGGLYLSAKTATISRNTFRANAIGTVDAAQRGFGGAVIVYKGSAQPVSAALSFNVFTENIAGIGSAIFIDDGAVVTMSHDLIYKNRAYADDGSGLYRGSSLYVDGSDGTAAGGSKLTAEYLTVVNNRYDDLGNLQPANLALAGNVYVEQGSKATFTNSIFYNNGDRAFFVEAGNEITVSYSIAPTNCTSSDAMGFIPASAAICKIGAGVITPAAIQFVNEGADDFHERSTGGHWTSGGFVVDLVTSPAIDVGDPAATPGNEPAPNGGRANVGAFARTKEASKSP